MGVKLISGDEDIILATRHGQSIRFSHEDVRAMGRPARGVIGIRLDLDDSVVGMDTIGPADVDGSHLLVVTENGYGKRTPVSHYGVQGRGGKGLKTLQMIKKNGPIVGAKVVRDDHDLMFISAEEIVIRVKASEISVMGRLTQGVRVMTMGEGDSLVAMAKIASRDEENEANRVQEENEPEGPSDGMEELPLLPANETADEE